MSECPAYLGAERNASGLSIFVRFTRMDAIGAVPLPSVLRPAAAPDGCWSVVSCWVSHGCCATISLISYSCVAAAAWQAAGAVGFAAAVAGFPGPTSATS